MSVKLYLRVWVVARVAAIVITRHPGKAGISFLPFTTASRDKGTTEPHIHSLRCAQGQ